MSAYWEIAPEWRFALCPDPPEWKLDFAALVERFEWLRALAECPQDAEWHAEGDVLRHMEMVMGELVRMQAWRELPEVERHVVFAATLLHDVGKPACTRVEEGRIRSKGHSEVGAHLAREILARTAGLCDGAKWFGVREAIVALVRRHGLPPYLFKREDPVRSVVSASMSVRLDWLCVLAEADARGRICRGPDDAVEQVALFREFCEEEGCLKGPYGFASAHSRFRYFHSENLLPSVSLFDDCRCEVTVMSGLPASGKDTWIKRNAGERPMVSLDELRAEMGVHPAADQARVVDAAKEMARENLRARRDFIWNATNSTRFVRDGLVRFLADYQARIRIVYCEAGIEEVKRRNGKRKEPVPVEVLERLWGKLEVPTELEVHEVEYVIQ